MKTEFRLVLVSCVLSAGLLGGLAVGGCESEPEKPMGRNPGAKPVRSGMIDSQQRFAQSMNLENNYDGQLPAWWSDAPQVGGQSASVCSVGAAGELSVAYDLALRNAKASGREAMHVTPERVEVLHAGVSRTPGGDYVVRMLTRCDAPGAALAAVPPEVAPVAVPVIRDVPVVAYAPEVKATPVAVPPAATPAAPADLTDVPPTWYVTGTTLAGGRYTVGVRRDAKTLVEARRLVLDAGRDELSRVSGGEAKDVQTLQTAVQKLPDGTWRAYASMSAIAPEVSK